MDSIKEILPHGELNQITDKLWTLEGTLPHGNPLPRTMTIYKMKDGNIWIHSAIAIEDSALEKLKALGVPKYLVVPNTMHRLDASFYKEKFPNILVVCPKAAIEEVEKEVHVDLSCEEAFAYNSEIKAVNIPGAKSIELAYELKLSQRTKAFIFNDLIVNQDEVQGWKGFILKHVGRIGFFRTPPITKMILLENKKIFKDWLYRLSEREDIKVITVAHGNAVTDQIQSLLRRASAQI